MTSVTALGHARGENIAFEDYLEHVLGNVVPLAPVEVGLAQAAGLVTSEPARALAPAPAFTNSAMDGFALNTADLPGSGKVRLPVSGDIPAGGKGTWTADRKSTRLNSSHVASSYAVFCLKKKKRGAGHQTVP